MTHKYTITGMFCDGCRTKVEKALNAMEGIEATVTLDPPIATITMQKPIQTTQFQEVLTAAGKYSIKVYNPNDLKLPAEEVVVETEEIIAPEEVVAVEAEETAATEEVVEAEEATVSGSEAE